MVRRPHVGGRVLPWLSPSPADRSERCGSALSRPCSPWSRGHASWEREVVGNRSSRSPAPRTASASTISPAARHIAVPVDIAAVRGGRYWDPLATFGYLAAVTHRIRLATFVLVLGYHHPLQIAKQYGTLDVVAGGRLILGVGVGSLREEFDLLDRPLTIEASGRTTRFAPCAPRSGSNGPATTAVITITTGSSSTRMPCRRPCRSGSAAAPALVAPGGRAGRRLGAVRPRPRRDRPPPPSRPRYGRRGLSARSARRRAPAPEGARPGR